VLGTHVVRELCERGHDVRILSRSDSPPVPDGVSTARGDVRTGEGLAEAMRDVGCVVHAASNPFRRARSTEVDGTTNVLVAGAEAGVDHVVYVSIVGVDRQRAAYYRAKWEAEQVVEQASIGWTIQRITQFHELIDRGLGLPIFVRTRDLRFQPIAATDAAVRLADLVDAGPGRRADDIGGPEVLGMRELAAQRREVMGRRTFLVPVPPVGPLADWDAGVHLAPHNPFGTTTWRAWLGQR
jgi:uncharacterized protein YbjT (DUF2867 family)